MEGLGTVVMGLLLIVAAIALAAMIYGGVVLLTWNFIVVPVFAAKALSGTESLAVGVIMIILVNIFKSTTKSE